jgi:pilus assembly protein CpaF
LVSGVSISLDAIHRQTAAAIDLIVQQEQLVDGSRKITHISQVNGLKDGRVHIEDIFAYEMDGIDANGVVHGRWRATGVVPVFYPIFKKLNISLPREIFNKD